MWEGIERAINRSAIFDFEGSMVAGVERFFRGLGGVQTPRYVAIKDGRLMRVAGAVRAALSR
jgi:hypothetical protein